MRDEYNPNKFMHHPEKLAAQREGRQTAPIFVQLNPTNRCNLNCRFCAYRMRGFHQSQLFDVTDEIKHRKLIEIIDDCYNMGVKGIQFTGGGEPLLHPRIVDIFQAVLMCNLKLGLLTNGIPLTDDLCYILSEASWLRFSIDTINIAAFESVKRSLPDLLCKQINNIKKFIRINRNATIGVSLVIEPEAVNEIYLTTKYFKDMGVDNVKFSAAITCDRQDHFANYLETALEQAARAQELQDNNFSVFNLFPERSQNIYESPNYDICYFKEWVTVIGADLNVYTCCMMQHAELGLIGSIKNRSFAEFWESAEKKLFFDGHSPKTHCPYPCIYKGKNERLEYMLKQNPKHVEFV
jgi:MoaA/NifB/PqqE/SkfB family radical SAM enzyme